MAKQKTSILDDLQHFFVAVPWWVGPIVAVAIYGLLRFMIPPILPSVFPAGTSPTSAVMNKTFVQILGPVSVAVAPWAACLVLLVWLVSLIQKRKRRGLLNRTKELEDVRALPWEQFELLVGEYYRRRGFMVEERGGASPDGGIDIVLKKGGRTILVQCKHWKVLKVGVRPVRELLGVMSHECANGGILVTSGQFSAEANDFAQKNGIELVDGEALVSMVRSVQEARGRRAANDSSPRPEPTVPFQETSTAPACPKCGSPMVLRTAKRGPNAGSQFYGCQKYPACRGIRNVVASDR